MTVQHTLELLNKEQLWQHYCYSVVSCHISNCWSSFAAPRPVKKIQNLPLTAAAGPIHVVWNLTSAQRHCQP